jgi:hypothetical protein
MYKLGELAAKNSGNIPPAPPAAGIPDLGGGGVPPAPGGIPDVTHYVKPGEHAEKGYTAQGPDVKPSEVPADYTDVVDALKATGIRSPDAVARVQAVIQDLQKTGSPVNIENVLKGALQRGVPKVQEIGTPAVKQPEMPGNQPPAPQEPFRGRVGTYKLMPNDNETQAAIKMPDGRIVTMDKEEARKLYVQQLIRQHEQETGEHIFTPGELAIDHLLTKATTGVNNIFRKIGWGEAPGYEASPLAEPEDFTPPKQMPASPLPDDENFNKWFGNSQIKNENGSPKVVFHTSRTPQDFDTFDPSKQRSLGLHFGTADQAAWVGTHGGEGTRTYPAYLKMEHPLKLDEDLGFTQPESLMNSLTRKGILAPEDRTTYNSKIGLDDRQQISDEVKTREAQESAILRKLDPGEKYFDFYSDDLPNRVQKAFGQNPDKASLVKEFMDNHDALADSRQKLFDWYNDKRKTGLSAIEDILKSKGYDGYIYPNEYEGRENAGIVKSTGNTHSGNSYAVFDPNQIKSAIANRTFNPEDPRIQMMPSSEIPDVAEKKYLRSANLGAARGAGEPVDYEHGAPMKWGELSQDEKRDVAQICELSPGECQNKLWPELSAGEQKRLIEYYAPHVGAESPRYPYGDATDDRALFNNMVSGETGGRTFPPPATKFMPSSNPDAIRESAVKYDDGKVYTGATHGEAFDTGWNDGHEDQNPIKGYVTNKDEFLEPHEAHARALKLNQIDAEDYENAFKANQFADDNMGLESMSFGTTRKFMPHSIIGHIDANGDAQGVPSYDEYPVNHADIGFNGKRWRYDPTENKVNWWEAPTDEEKDKVHSYINLKGGSVDKDVDLSKLANTFQMMKMFWKGKAMPATVNIGLKVGENGAVSSDEALHALRGMGVNVTNATTAQSSTEPTLVASLDKALTPDQANDLSKKLGQEAIAQVSQGKGELYGPGSENWKPFNPDYFMMHSGQTLSDEIKNYRQPSAGGRWDSLTAGGGQPLDDAAKAIGVPSDKRFYEQKPPNQQKISDYFNGHTQLMPSSDPDAIDRSAIMRKSDGKIFSPEPMEPHYMIPYHNPEASDYLGIDGQKLYDEGFLDKKGNWYDRSDAFQRMKETGQLPPGYKSEYSDEASQTELRNSKWMPGVDLGKIQAASDNPRLKDNWKDVSSIQQGSPVMKGTRGYLVMKDGRLFDSTSEMEGTSGLGGGVDHYGYGTALENRDLFGIPKDADAPSSPETGSIDDPYFKTWDKINKATQARVMAMQRTADGGGPHVSIQFNNGESPKVALRKAQEWLGTQIPDEPEKTSYSLEVYPGGDTQNFNSVKELMSASSPQRSRWMPGQKTWDQIAPLLDGEELSQVQDSYKGKIVDAFKKLNLEKGVQYAQAGASGKNWYTDAVNAIHNLVGSDVPANRSDPDRFAGLLAALSPNRAVSTDLTHTLNFWATWDRMGRPTDRDTIEDIMGRTNVNEGSGSLPAYIGNAMRVLTADDPASVRLSGPKVDPFYANLRGDVNKVTNDRHMGMYGFGETTLGKRNTTVATQRAEGGTRQIQAAKGLAMTAHIRQVAQRLSDISGETWTPAQTQAAIWTYQLPLQDVADAMKTTTKKLLAQGYQLPPEMLDKVPSLANLMQNETNHQAIRSIRQRRAANSSAASRTGQIPDTQSSAFAPEDSGIPNVANPY